MRARLPLGSVASIEPRDSTWPFSRRTSGATSSLPRSRSVTLAWFEAAAPGTFSHAGVEVERVEVEHAPEVTSHGYRIRLDGRVDRPLETPKSMKYQRITPVHQSLTFSRRMMVFGGAQAAIGALLVGRLGWLSIKENQHYSLLSESNRVQLIVVPPRRGWRLAA